MLGRSHGVPEARGVFIFFCAQTHVSTTHDGFRFLQYSTHKAVCPHTSHGQSTHGTQVTTPLYTPPLTVNSPHSIPYTQSTTIRYSLYRSLAHLDPQHAGETPLSSPPLPPTPYLRLLHLCRRHTGRCLAVQLLQHAQAVLVPIASGVVGGREAGCICRQVQQATRLPTAPQCSDMVAAYAYCTRLLATRQIAWRQPSCP